MGTRVRYNMAIHLVWARQPLHPRTGAIFRRKNARLLVGSDFEWFAKTIIAEGPHIAVWVDGFLVTDWVDRRKPNQNPRRGQRLDVGNSIMIQAHDPTTELSFRKFQVGEMKSRR